MKALEIGGANVGDRLQIHFSRIFSRNTQTANHMTLSIGTLLGHSTASINC